MPSRHGCRWQWFQPRVCIHPKVTWGRCRLLLLLLLLLWLYLLLLMMLVLLLLLLVVRRLCAQVL